MFRSLQLRNGFSEELELSSILLQIIAKQVKSRSLVCKQNAFFGLQAECVLLFVCQQKAFLCLQAKCILCLQPKCFFVCKQNAFLSASKGLSFVCQQKARPCLPEKSSPLFASKKRSKVKFFTSGGHSFQFGCDAFQGRGEKISSKACVYFRNSGQLNKS